MYLQISLYRLLLHWGQAEQKHPVIHHKVIF